MTIFDSNRAISSWYGEAVRALTALGVDSPRTEALILCEHFFNIKGRAGLLIHSDDIPAPQAAENFAEALTRREHRPLPYILGRWEFMGMALAVGEGVLIPRDDTVILAETAITITNAECGMRNAELDFGEANSPHIGVRPFFHSEFRIPNPALKNVLDLCSGTGAVGLAVVRNCPAARCVLAELSEDALPYLRRNADEFGDGRAEVLVADVLAGPTNLDMQFDLITANPPYIPTGDISGLSREVRQEPRLALDGGPDGLVFYRIICKKWLAVLAPGGWLVVEVGIGQAEDVAAMMQAAGLTEIAITPDLSDIPRVVAGKKIS